MRTEQEVRGELAIFEQTKEILENTGELLDDNIVFNVVLANIRLCKWFLGEDVEQIALEVDGVLL